MTIFDTFVDDVAIEPTYSDIRKLYRRQLGATTATSQHTSYSYHTIAICTVRFCILHSLLWGSTVGYPIENSDSLASCASVTIHNVQSRLHQNMPVQDQKIKNFVGEEFPQAPPLCVREGPGTPPHIQPLQRLCHSASFTLSTALYFGREPLRTLGPKWKKKK